jgi:hypothetical protein
VVVVLGIVLSVGIVKAITHHTDSIRVSTTVLRPPVALTTIAGDGTAGRIGAGGLAVAAELNFCSNSTFGTTCGSSLGEDQFGNVYFPEEGNDTVQMVAGSKFSPFLPRQPLTVGYLYTVAGSGIAGNGGNSSSAIGAELNGPCSVAIDKFDNLIIANIYAGTVRLVAGSTSDPLLPGYVLTPGNIYTIVGGLNSPSGVAFDPSGNLIIVEMGANSVWLLATNNADPLLPSRVLVPGRMYLVAGDGTPGYSGDHGPATDAELTWPFGVSVDQHGNIYISDPRSGVIRLVAATTSVAVLPDVTLTPGDIYTVVGTGTQGYSGNGGPAVRAEIDQAIDMPGTTAPKYGSVALDKQGNLYIADSSNQVIRVVAATPSVAVDHRAKLTAGDIYVLAGNGSCGFTTTELCAPTAILVRPDGTFLFIDAGNNVVRSARA